MKQKVEVRTIRVEDAIICKRAEAADGDGKGSEGLDAFFRCTAENMFPTRFK